MADLFYMAMIMDYEEKYNYVLGRAEKLKKSCSLPYIKDWVDNVFPELRESEDERIRKGLIKAVSGTLKGNTLFGTDVTREEALAWLEKQKEFVSADFDDVWDTADCDKLTAPLEKYSKDAIKEMCHEWYYKGIELERKSWLEKQGEQKECTFKSLPRLLDMIEPTSKAKAYCQKLIDTLVKEGYVTDAKIVEECLKQMNGEKVALATMDEKQAPKLKWTEEDEKVFNNLIVGLIRISHHTFTDCTSPNYTFFTEIEWLKELKQRMEGK